jgi:hypothetical protein
MAVAACRCPRFEVIAERPFEFARDTVGFTNLTRWIYEFDEEGQVNTHPRTPRPAYTHRCFAVARLNRQFFDHATFEAAGPRPPLAELRSRVRQVVSRSARRPAKPGERVVFSGFAGLRELSEAHPELLQRLGGRAAESYFQRGHWRLVFPFSRGHQARQAELLAERLGTGRPLVVHLVRFPSLSINHAVLLFACRPTDAGWAFDAADPNDPQTRLVLEFENNTRSFYWPRTHYFAGGRVDVYEVYRNAWY